ncbi:hypothetical protein [Pseudoduganella chitinolytica]|uniref:Uncharacterized protein n=1 Tax=Pseudoduganella chitinolytica TaxID=34070 RepID=A0ABY8BFV9_9BURK|nr:hypothetical protein [Pseudoduganella chitinolytica]WEF34268.1 hypothetical protein PX653_05715 [Pseudoduganella chitinolytica]
MANIVLSPCWRPGRSGVPAAWFDLADEAAQILAFLTSSLQGVYVTSQRDGTPSLLYAYTVGGDLCLDHGRPRLETVPRRFASIWHRLPAPLRQFYETLHNGWTFQPSNSMGPLPVEDWAFLSEDRFDIDAVTARAMQWTAAGSWRSFITAPETTCASTFPTTPASRRLA